MSLNRGALLAIAAAGLLIAHPSPATEPSHPQLLDYQDLQEWAFTASPTELGPEGLHWQVDVGDWHLDQGRLWLQRPTPSGQRTGFVFEGRGHYQIEVPDPVELRQLRRFTGEPELEGLSGTFEALVVRGTSLPPIDGLSKPPASVRFTTHSLAKQRHQHWLALRAFDVDARVIAALSGTADAYLRVDMKTREYGWLTFDFDARRAEEIVVEWFNSDFSVVERWLSIDRQEDRQSDGRPTSEPRPRLDIRHISIDADLTHFAKESQRGAARIRPVDARIEATLDFEPLAEGARSLQLYLHPWAKIESIRDDAGQELAWIRDHLGKRSSAIRNRVYDDSLVVLLDRPLQRGVKQSLIVLYELELSGYAPGRSWYPSATYPGTGLFDLHTANLTVHQRPNFATESMGTVVREETADGIRTTEWQLREPIKMLTLVFAKKHFEESFSTAGATQVVAFSSLGGFITRGRVRQLGEDAVRILDYYEELFAVPADTEELILGLVPASHGQAFQGLIHIGDYSTLTDRVAERELFRAHEIAHLWWGHQVGWHGYRDQWLSEGFSQYSAMMFVEANLANGEKYFDEMLESFSNELSGSIKSGFSQFSQPGVSLLNKRAADRVGPVGFGRRCIVGEAPTAYRSQTYKRGALALHSLRMLLRARTGSDDAFIAILREFLTRFQNASPSTTDFQAVVESHAGSDWSWFFDTWIYRAEIPTYVWRDRVSPGSEGFMLDLEVETRGVDAGATMEIPIRVELEDGSEQTLLALVDEPAETFRFALPSRPTRVVFNPDHAVLARVKKR